MSSSPLAANSSSPAVRRGRPKGGFNAAIDWTLAERLYVEGELTDHQDGTRRIFPSVSTIARRSGTSKANLLARAARYKWAIKRREFNSVTSDEREVTSAEAHVDRPAKPRKKSTPSPEEILTEYIGQFADAVEKGMCRLDTVADLDRAVRLLAFVRGQAESVSQVRQTISLEVMQEKHSRSREYVRAHVNDAVAGVIGQASERVSK